MFATTCASVEPTIEKLKYNSKQRNMIPMPVPTIVSLYNKHVRGIDRLNHLIELYRSVIHSKKFNHKIFLPFDRYFYHLKFYLKIIYYFINMICASA